MTNLTITPGHLESAQYGGRQALLAAAKREEKRTRFCKSCRCVPPIAYQLSGESSRGVWLDFWERERSCERVRNLTITSEKQKACNWVKLRAASGHALTSRRHGPWLSPGDHGGWNFLPRIFTFSHMYHIQNHHSFFNNFPFSSKPFFG